ncbi:MAG TPA: choice-of-anchor J domain-containing protein [Flavobacterium sp.]
MKINILHTLFVVAALVALSACTKDDDIELPDYGSLLFFEDFSDATDNTPLNTTGWTNFAETGTKVWSEQSFSENGYAEFSSFGSREAVNVGWLISPPVDMDLHEGEKLIFQSAQNFLRSRDNTLELLVSTDFDGTNVTAASWELIPVITPTPDTERYLFIGSGIIDLSSYTGTLYFAFKVRGSGTNSNLTGTYQIDNIRLFY